MDCNSEKNAAAVNFLEKVVNFKKKLHQRGTILVVPDKNGSNSSSEPPHKMPRDRHVIGPILSGEPLCKMRQEVNMRNRTQNSESMLPKKSCEVSNSGGMKTRMDVSGKVTKEISNLKSDLQTSEGQNNVEVIEIVDSDDEPFVVSPIFTSSENIKIKVEDVVGMDKTINPMDNVPNLDTVSPWLKQIENNLTQESLDINSQRHSIKSHPNVSGSVEMAMAKEKQLFEENDRVIQDLRSKITSFEQNMSAIMQKNKQEMNNLRVDLMRRENETNLLWSDLDSKIHDIQKLQTELSVHKQESYKLKSEIIDERVEVEKMRIILLKKDLLIQDLLNVGIQKNEEIKKLHTDLKRLKHESVSTSSRSENSSLEQKTEMNIVQQNGSNSSFQQAVVTKTEEDLSGRVTPLLRLVRPEEDNHKYMLNPHVITDSLDGRETPCLRTTNVRVKPEFSMPPDVINDVRGERATSCLGLQLHPDMANSDIGVRRRFLLDCRSTSQVKPEHNVVTDCSIFNFYED